MNIETVLSFVKNIEKYEAHIKENDKKEIVKREKLSEHMRLTEKYFNYIWNEKLISEMKDRFCCQRWGELTEEAAIFWKEMIFAIPLFHDLGKINPEFQKSKMQNKNVGEDDIFAPVGGKHSVISAVLYIDYFVEKLKECVKDKGEKKKIRPFILYHAYIIERHHSDLGEFEKFLQSLEYGSGKDVIEIFSEGKCSSYQKKFSLNEGNVQFVIDATRERQNNSFTRAEEIGLYVYEKMLYSLLVASDYYATAEFMSGAKIKQIGNLKEIEKWVDVYENTKLMKGIRTYQKEVYPKSEEDLKSERDINHLRTEMLTDAEQILEKHKEETLFYLEAPTGSGKSNTAMDLSFKMMQSDSRLKKIYYIYPFNTLVEQNVESLKKVFGEEKEIFQNIAVVNSLTPIKMSQKEKAEEEDSEQTMYYQKALLDRQFLNYPMIISTHVSLFDTMFGDTKEAAFGFHQLMNSVIVLDEIQSYKNEIWGEIICFLKEFSYLLNIKLIIMSATLPNLDLLSEDTYKAVELLKDKEKYFSNPCFRERVEISYELLGKEDIENRLLQHIQKSAAGGEKVLIEFIKKESAYQFFKNLKENIQINCDVEYMSGDDNLMERSRILKKIKEQNQVVILVATQVIEAGVDIDMDIGYKNISKLDSEEQFLGRINRSCLRNGKVCFFKLDEGKHIYKGDIRIENPFTLENDEMKEILVKKEFSKYYERILHVLKKNRNEQISEVGLDTFFKEQAGKLNWKNVKERMKLIEENNWSMSVYLSRELTTEEGIKISGEDLWEQYVELLNDFKMDYAEKRVRLSQITSQMNYFIYQIKRNPDLIYNDKVGEIFYIKDGNQYFEDGKLNRKKVQGEIGEFVDFI